jgi:hydroxylamine reductase
VCGKQTSTADLQDLLIYLLKGISVVMDQSDDLGEDTEVKTGRFIMDGLFATITNVNFDDKRFYSWIEEAQRIRDELTANSRLDSGDLPDCVTWSGGTRDAIQDKAAEVGVLQTEDKDIRSLRELITYGIKGYAAYAHHAFILGYEDPDIYRFTYKTLAQLTRDISKEELTELVMQTGATAVKTMQLLDEAHTATYGNPEITTVNIGVRNNPAILISGHDLKDMEELLEQTKGSGVDVYTHGEMLPAHYYPVFKKYDHFAGNYGGSWWKQGKEFAAFNGPIIMTTNCITPVKDSYKDRIYTTDVVGYPEVQHIPDREDGRAKDFSAVIEQAKKCDSPTELENGEIVGGFAHNQVLALADKIVEAVSSGKIRRFVVMAGCDGRHKERAYYTEVAEKLPKDAVILTAGCAKYRYNKLDLGDIDGIPRVLDAGQCNDSYSLAVIALKLKEVFGAEDINELPIAFDIAWYEQKACTVFLALLYLGFKGIRIGPTLPAFLSENVTNLLVEQFDVKPTSSVDEDVETIMTAK